MIKIASLQYLKHGSNIQVHIQIHSKLFTKIFIIHQNIEAIMRSLRLQMKLYQINQAMDR